MSVMIVEDDVESNKNLQYLLAKHFKNVIGIINGAEAWEHYRLNRPDIIITDIEMPRLDGLELIKKIRLIDPECFIAVLTAFSEKSYLLRAISLKLDLFLEKPLNSVQLNHLLQTIKKSKTTFNRPVTLFENDAKYDHLEKIFYSGNKRIKLTHNEILLLELLIQNRHDAVEYDTIGYTLHNSDELSRNAIKILIGRLRKKTTLLIKAIPKIGYLLE